MIKIIEIYIIMAISICPSVCLSVCPNISICPSVCLSVCPNKNICPSVCLSVCPNISICSSVCLNICPFVCLSVCPNRLVYILRIKNREVFCTSIFHTLAKVSSKHMSVWTCPNTIFSLVFNQNGKHNYGFLRSQERFGS